MNTGPVASLLRECLVLPWPDAQALIKHRMDEEGGYSALDYKLLELSLSTEEAVGLIFGEQE